MPYIIKKVKEDGQTGYKVCKRDEPSRCFSKHTMTEEKAKKQRTAIIMSEMGISRKTGGAGSSKSKKKSTAFKNDTGLSKDDIIAELRFYFNDKVNEFLEDNKKPLLPDWVALYKQLEPELEKAKEEEERRMEEARRKLMENPSYKSDREAKDATEALQRLGLGNKPRSQSPK